MEDANPIQPELGALHELLDPDRIWHLVVWPKAEVVVRAAVQTVGDLVRGEDLASFGVELVGTVLRRCVPFLGPDPAASAECFHLLVCSGDLLDHFGSLRSLFVRFVNACVRWGLRVLRPWPHQAPQSEMAWSALGRRFLKGIIAGNTVLPWLRKLQQYPSPSTVFSHAVLCSRDRPTGFLRSRQQMPFMPEVLSWLCANCPAQHFSAPALDHFLAIGLPNVPFTDVSRDDHCCRTLRRAALAWATDGPASSAEPLPWTLFEAASSPSEGQTLGLLLLDVLHSRPLLRALMHVQAPPGDAVPLAGGGDFPSSAVHVLSSALVHPVPKWRFAMEDEGAVDALFATREALGNPLWDVPQSSRPLYEELRCCC